MSPQREFYNNIVTPQELQVILGMDEVPGALLYDVCIGCWCATDFGDYEFQLAPQDGD